VTTLYTYYEKKYSDLIIYDIKNGNNPEKISEIDKLPWINDIQLNENFIYAAFDDSNNNSAGLLIIDVSDITSPALKGNIYISGFATGLAVLDNHVFLLEDTFGLKIIDVSSAEKPVLSGGLEIGNHSTDVILEDNYAYISNGYDGLKKIYLTDLKKPEIVDNIETNGFVKSLFLSDKYIFLAAGRYLTVLNKF
jgi:hypothetical protein